MLREFQFFNLQHKLFKDNDKILIASSGGIDSSVLLDLFLKSDVEIALAHCNFSLRGAESKEEEKFLQILFNTLEYANKHAISTQMAARELRYSWFEKKRKELGFTSIATAHHQNDVVETMLINLLRGTGIAGLHGILPKSGNLIRPLLFSTKKNIEAYAAKHKLAYKTDSSNSETDYLRNKIRHWVVPQLQKINPQFSQSFYETACRLSDTELLFKSVIDLKIALLEKKTKNEILYSIAELKKLHPLSLYLYEFLKRYSFTAATCKDIETSLLKEPGTLFYSASHRLLVDREQVIISKINSQNSKEIFYMLEKQKEQKIPIHLHITKKVISDTFKVAKSKKIAQVDAAKINFPLVIRKWQKGDTFQPLGMKGHKKLSDFFIDNKLSIFEKEKIWLICSGNKIVWIINHRMDEHFKISPKTKKIVQFEYIET
jgi:tRNA(Ile)-lysidine synthase